MIDRTACKRTQHNTTLSQPASNSSADLRPKSITTKKPIKHAAKRAAKQPKAPPSSPRLNQTDHIFLLLGQAAPAITASTSATDLGTSVSDSQPDGVMTTLSSRRTEGGGGLGAWGGAGVSGGVGVRGEEGVHWL